MCRLSKPMIRVWSFLRLPGSNCAKAIRDMRSPPKTAWGFRLETDASCSPESSSISVLTTLVVPMSTARPNFIPAVSPRSTATTRSLPRPPGGADVRRGHAQGGGELLEVGDLVVLLAGQADLHDLLPDPGVERDAAHSNDARPGAQDLERALLERRRDLDGHGLTRHALAGEPVALADKVVTELDLVHDRRRRDRAGDELHPAGGASAPASARGGDLDGCRVRRFQDRGVGREGERPSWRGVAGIGQDGQEDGHAPSF